MISTVIQPDAQFLTDVHIEARPEYKPKSRRTKKIVKSDLDWYSAYISPDDAGKLRLHLLLTPKTGKAEKMNWPYSFSISVHGVFSTLKPLKNRLTMKRAQGEAFEHLYRCVREVVASVTALGPWQTVVLPEVPGKEILEIAKIGDASKTPPKASKTKRKKKPTKA